MKKIISWRTLAERIDASVSTAKRLEKDDPDFPRKVRVSPGRVGFFEDEVDEYIAARTRACTASAVRQFVTYSSFRSVCPAAPW